MQNTLIHIRFSLCNSGLICNEEYMDMLKIENIPLQPSSIYSWGGAAGCSWNWLMHYRQPLFALNPWSTVLLCREHNILTILLWNTTVYMYMCDLYIIHLVCVVFDCKKVFPPPDCLGNSLCQILLKSTLFCFQYNSQITLVCNFGAEGSLKASKIMELNWPHKTELGQYPAIEH